MSIIYYKCDICGNLLEVIRDSGVTPDCCGQSMTVLEPGTTETAREKHLPVLTVHDDILVVRVGATLHPSTAEHYIEWIEVLTDRANYRRNIGPDHMPEIAVHLSAGERVLEVYSYCNLHGLWVSKA